MMNYTSTRGRVQQITAEEAILQGLAPDGGLYVPLSFPLLQDAQSLRSFSYPELVSAVLLPFFSYLSKDELTKAAERAYASFPPAPLRLLEREEMAVLELFHGPTLAFKDMALCLLPHLMKLAKKHLGRDEKTLLLTATSGDTGIAAIEGFAGVEGFSTIVFYPKDGVSPLQERQMLTTQAKNATVIGLRGNFDDAQSGVKQMLSDERFHQKLREKGWKVASANSINLGRLLAQIVYYVYATLHVEHLPLRFSVPTGNFGNVLAAHWARKMGAPITELMIATNENDVLDQFFQSGIYDARRKLIRSQSPSMDILVSSNLERLLYETGGEEEVRRAMQELDATRRFVWTHPFDGFTSGSVREDEVREEIRRVWSEEQILLDPHTAVASTLLHRRKEKGIVVATASPFKFPSFVLESLGKASSFDPIQDLQTLSMITDLPLPEPMRQLEESYTQERVCMKKDMEAHVLEVLDV